MISCIISITPIYQTRKSAIVFSTIYILEKFDFFFVPNFFRKKNTENFISNNVFFKFFKIL